MNMREPVAEVASAYQLARWVINMWAVCVGLYVSIIYVMSIASMNGSLTIQRGFDAWCWSYTIIMGILSAVGFYIAVSAIKALRDTQAASWVVVMFNRMAWAQIIFYFQLLVLYWVMHETYPQLGNSGNNQVLADITDVFSVGWFNLNFTQWAICLPMICMLLDVLVTKNLDYSTVKPASREN